MTNQSGKVSLGPSIVKDSQFTESTSRICFHFEDVKHFRIIENNLETKKGSRGRIWNFWTEEILDYFENDGISGNFTLNCFVSSSNIFNPFFS